MLSNTVKSCKCKYNLILYQFSCVDARVTTTTTQATSTKGTFLKLSYKNTSISAASDCFSSESVYFDCNWTHIWDLMTESSICAIETQSSERADVALYIYSGGAVRISVCLNTKQFHCNRRLVMVKMLSCGLWTLPGWLTETSWDLSKWGEAATLNSGYQLTFSVSYYGSPQSSYLWYCLWLWSGK